MSVREQAVGQFERWSPTAFVVGGVGILGTTVVGSLDVAGVVSTPEWVMVPLLFGLWFVFVGLTGLYDTIAERSPRLARGGFWTSAIAWIAWTATMLAAGVVDVTSERTFAEPGSWAPPLLAGAFVLALLSFLAYGIASTRSAVPSRTFGILLLIPVAGFLGLAVLLLSKIVTGEVVAVLQLALGGITAVVLVAVGYLHWRDSKQVTGPESRAKPTG
ncbi:hypothetical protein [Halomarina oriensis]|uniref:Uncharacterized protein n=1 Tax=Halomarina oriensis TaxID=671145 RepID=A0A6B0GQK6_9EURY|nr:hypothetical protein [Halomarina oriensis]MWG33948.1 hypothetical protein [Halomarina oriensis]